MIKAVVFKFEDQKYLPLSIHQAKTNFYSFRRATLDHSDYLERFNNLVNMASALYGKLYDQAIMDITTEFHHPGIDFKDLSNAQQLFIQEVAKEQNLACAFICQSERRHYGRLLEGL
jgi:hypothetical protein